MSTNTQDVTSLSLLARARQQDEQAWQQLVHVYGPLVERWCRRGGLSDNDAADVFQESFRAVSTNLHSFVPSKSVGAFRSWLRTIVRTKVADHYRRRNRQPVAQGGTAANLQLAEVPDALLDEEPGQASSDHALIVRRALELIKPDFNPQNWNAFWQVAVEGKSAVDVAQTLGVNPQAVRQANYRIRRRLRLVLKGLVDDQQLDGNADT